jgi:DNA-binding transcriptional ArsR family regulator
LKNDEQMMDEIFFALSDKTRRHIVQTLLSTDRPITVTELAEPYEMSLPAVSKHLKILMRSGLIKQEKEGRIRFCKVELDPMKSAFLWLGNYRMFWESNLDQLGKFLERED